MSQPKQVQFSSKPPLFSWILRFRFGFDFEHNVVVFGDTIYTKYPMPRHLLAHEESHIKQQGYSKIKAIVWWARYLTSAKFRLNQELDAYRQEYAYIQKHESDSRRRMGLLDFMSNQLSGPLYGNLIKFHEASKRIAT